MKKIIFLCLLAVLITITACVPDGDLSQKSAQKIDEVYPYSEVNVECPEGKYALLTLGKDTLLFTGNSGIYYLPKDIEGATKAIPKFRYIDVAGTQIASNKQTFLQTIAWEDSKNGDYDYNDLIIHTRVDIYDSEVSIKINPIAYGAIKQLGLGIMINGKDYLISDNCRADFFNNVEGFINTYKINFKSDSVYQISIPVEARPKMIDWYLVADGQKLFAVSKLYSEKAADNNGEPLGLIFSNIRKKGLSETNDIGYEWWEYPKEKMNINTVYPKISAYTNGNKTITFYYFSNYDSKNPPLFTISEDCIYNTDFNVNVKQFKSFK